MGAIEINSSSTVCRRCGTAYSRLKGYFPISYSPLYKGVGYLPYCRNCVDSIYSEYLAECKNTKDAVRQTCRKLDLYWSEKIFAAVENNTSTRSMMTMYMQKANSVATSTKSYDDTLREESSLWRWGQASSPVMATVEQVNTSSNETASNVEDDIVGYWGAGYSTDTYKELERKKETWASRIGGELDVGTEALVKQLCYLEIDINRARIAGSSTDKLVNTYNTLIGSIGLKPSQRKDSNDSTIDSTPLGVWAWKYENLRPIPETDPELQDVDGIVKYITTWLFGHLQKMLNIKGTRSKLYEDAIAKYRASAPEYDDEDDDENFLYDIFSDSSDSGEEDEENSEDGQ